MSAKYLDYGYRSPEPGNGDDGRALASRFVAVLSRVLPPASRICDLGCGNGYLASRLANHGYDVTGVDASDTGIEIARAHHGSANVRFFRANLDSPEVERIPGAGAFHAAVSSDVIEHLYRPAALVEAAARLVKPGGLLVVGTPYHGYLKNLAISALGKWDRHHTVDWDGGHIKFFSVRTLSELLGRHGFSVESWHYHGRVRWLWKSMICVSRKGAEAT